MKELQKSGCDMKKMSIVGKNYHTDEQVVGYYNTGDRTKYWGKMGALWGGIWAMYGSNVARQEVLDGKVAVPKSARRLVANLARYEPHAVESSRN